MQGRDLGGVAADIDKVATDLKKQLQPGNTIQVIGQIQSMNDSFRDLGIGLLFAAVLVYLLMVVNYQNFGDPFVVDPGVAGDLLRHPGDALRHRNDAQRSVADGRDHGGRRRLGELDLAGHLRTRAADRRPQRVRSGDLRGAHPYPAGADDGGGDDRRHDPDGDRRAPARNRTLRSPGR